MSYAYRKNAHTHQMASSLQGFSVSPIQDPSYYEFYCRLSHRSSVARGQITECEPLPLSGERDLQPPSHLFSQALHSRAPRITQAIHPPLPFFTFALGRECHNERRIVHHDSPTGRWIKSSKRNTSIRLPFTKISQRSSPRFFVGYRSTANESQQY